MWCEYKDEWILIDWYYIYWLIKWLWCIICIDELMYLFWYFILINIDMNEWHMWMCLVWFIYDELYIWSYMICCTILILLYCIVYDNIMIEW